VFGGLFSFAAQALAFAFALFGLAFRFEVALFEGGAAEQFRRARHVADFVAGLDFRDRRLVIAGDDIPHAVANALDPAPQPAAMPGLQAYDRQKR